MIRALLLIVGVFLLFYIFKSMLAPVKHNNKQVEPYIDKNFILKPYNDTLPLNKSIEKSWNKIISHWKNNKPTIAGKPCKQATKEELDELQVALQVNLPKSFLDNLRICNESLRIIDNENWFGWFGPEHRYVITHSTTYGDIVYNNYQMRELYQDEWNPKWIQFYDWNTNYNLYLDMSNGKGAVYIFDPEMAEPLNKYKWTDSYEEWLEIVAVEVENYDELRCETLETVLGISSDNNTNITIPPLTDKEKALEKAVKGMLQNEGWTDEAKDAFKNNGANKETLEQMKNMWKKKD